MQRRAFEAAQRAAGGITSSTPAQKLLLVLVVVGLALGGTAFWRWVSTPSYAPLFTNLATEDASAIVEQLGADGVDYRLEDGGASVMVPQDRVYDLRLAMSAEGLPAAEGTGYSLLDEQGVTASQFQQQVAWQRAMEGELASTIGSISGVEAATVHLAIPQDDVFLEETASPTASVLVQQSRGQEMSNQQVSAVVHLVSSAVEGMAPEDVTVVDGEGQLLSADGAGLGGAAGTRDSATGEYETRVRGQLQAMLDRVVGPGAAVATVTATLDLDSTDTTSESFTAPPEGTPAISETTGEEVYEGAGSAATGVLGPDNIAVPGGEAAGDSSYTKSNATRNNAVGKVVERRVGTPGDVERQSVAVVVDTARAGTVDLAGLEELVRAAAGVDEARGDTLAVTRMAFDTASAEAAEEGAQQAAEAEAAQRQQDLIRTAVLAGVVLLLLVVAAIGARRRSKRAARAEQERWEQVLDVDRAALGAAPDAPVIDPAQLKPALPAAPEPQVERAREVRREVEALVERQPDEVAELLRGWLADRRS